MADTKARIYEIVAEHFARDVGEITDETKFAEDLGADSLDPIEISIAVDDLLGVELSFNIEWKTVGDLVAGVQARANAEEAVG